MDRLAPKAQGRSVAVMEDGLHFSEHGEGNRLGRIAAQVQSDGGVKLASGLWRDLAAHGLESPRVYPPRRSKGVQRSKEQRGSGLPFCAQLDSCLQSQKGWVATCKT